MFISFEGGEGAGKSTQIGLLAGRFHGLGKRVLQLREPGSAPGAEAIRDLVLNGAVERWHPVEELLLFSAARHELVRTKILPALQEETVVLCDRYADSSAVYQGRAGGVAPNQLKIVEDLATDGLMPDLTLLFDLPVEIGLARAGKRIADAGATLDEGRFEGKDMAFHKRVRQAFLERADESPDRFCVLDGTLSIEDLSEAVWSAVQQRLEA